jgi:hypothetical protein
MHLPSLSTLALLGIGDASFSGRASDKWLNVLTDLKDYAHSKLKETTEPYSPSPDYPYFNMFPSYIGSLYDKKESVTWSGKCFNNNSAFMEILSDKSSVTITIQSEGPNQLGKCVDFYYLGCTAIHKDAVITSGHDTSVLTTTVVIDLPSDITSAEWFDIDNKGIRLSLYPNDPSTTFSNILATVALFEPEFTDVYPPKVVEMNLDFLNKYTGFDTVTPVDPASFVLPDAKDIHSGRHSYTYLSQWFLILFMV